MSQTTCPTFLYDQTFIVQCSKCGAIVADSSMMLNMKKDFGIFLKLNKSVIRIGTKSNFIISKCGEVIGAWDALVPEVENSILYKIYWKTVKLNTCGFSCRPMVNLNEKISVVIETNRKIK
eukprot:NODE_247_length_12991_cov_0.678328.p9 type:complete len:121 gc:universal NODE_247_length_12991_cov_0.678328:304-666(+)